MIVWQRLKVCRMRRLLLHPSVFTAQTRRLASLLVGLCLLQNLLGCQLASDRVDLAIQIPNEFRASPGHSDTALPTLDWWRGFRSSELTALIEQAQVANLDIAAAVARIMQADAQARMAGAPLLPTVDLGAGALRSRPSANTGSGGGAERSLFSTSLSASYEIDFWGKNRAALLAAEYTAVASRFDHEVIALTTVVAVANTYFQVLSTQDRLRIARENVAAAERILALIQQRLNVGTASSLDVAQQESLVATQRAAIPPLTITLRQSIAALAVLMGLPPEYFSMRGGSLQRVAIPRVTPGIPSDLLQRRPDIRETEAQLAAATANIANARAQFFPSISLTGDGGFQSAALRTLFAAGAWQYAVAANLVQPIFQGGRLIGNFELQQAKQEELLQNYRKAVISAFADVETALIALRQQTQRERLQAAAARASRQAFQLSETRLREGAIDLITVLNTQQTLFQAEDTLAQVRLARLQAAVSLFQALGGGWPPLEGNKSRGTEN